jgi:hypothetical protein
MNVRRRVIICPYNKSKPCYSQHRRHGNFNLSVRFTQRKFYSEPCRQVPPNKGRDRTDLRKPTLLFSLDLLQTLFQRGKFFLRSGEQCGLDVEFLPADQIELSKLRL